MRKTLNIMASKSALLLACLAVVLGMAVLLSSTANAAENVSTIHVLLLRFKTGAAFWQSTLSTLAQRLFWLLVSIELTWMAISMALRGADLGEWLQEITSQIFFIGFFYFLLFNAASIFSAIIKSFTGAAEQVASEKGFTSGGLAGTSTGQGMDLGGVDPVAIFDLGWKTATNLAGQASLDYFFVSILLLVAAFIVVVTFSLLCCMMIIALVESYVVMNAAVFFMGFGGSNWTKDFAVKMLRLAVSVGAKLFIMILLALLSVGIVESLGKFQPINCTFSHEKDTDWVSNTPMSSEQASSAAANPRDFYHTEEGSSSHKYTDAELQKTYKWITENTIKQTCAGVECSYYVERSGKFLTSFFGCEGGGCVEATGISTESNYYPTLTEAEVAEAKADPEEFVKRYFSNTYNKIQTNKQTAYQEYAGGVERECQAPDGTTRKILMLIAACILVWMLLKGVPSMLQGVLQGVASSSGAEAYASSWVPTPQKVAGVVAGVAAVEAPMLIGQTAVLSYKELRSEGHSRLGALGRGIFRGAKNLGKEAAATVGDKMTGRDSNPEKGRFFGRLSRGMGERLKDQKTLEDTGAKGSARHKWAPPHDTKPKPTAK